MFFGLTNSLATFQTMMNDSSRTSSMKDMHSILLYTIFTLAQQHYLI